MLTTDRGGVMPDGYELHVDLEDYVDFDSPMGPWLHHPFVIAPIGSPLSIKMANELYARKTALVDEAIEQQDWHGFVALHERPYRVEALQELIDVYGVSAKHLWPVVGYVWSDTESVQSNFQAWRTIWSTNSPDKVLVMDNEEREGFESLPERLIIWRGVNHQDAVRSYSWTLDRAKAVWFAQRFAKDQDPLLIARGWVNKSDVLAFFAGRKEAEIVTLPEDVQEIEIEDLRANVAPPLTSSPTSKNKPDDLGQKDERSRNPPVSFE
jgi:hypothetical protein